MELYHKYRPKTLDRVVGCDSTVSTLKAYLEKGTLPRALLFSGPSGCGKTTLARILKSELKCSDLDFKEVNSSSNRGIDTIREVQRLMQLSPVAGTCRIWLFDEVHQWSNDAQNGALKLLEDMPGHVRFFLCTTNPEKLIPAIRTRCCDLPVKALAYSELMTLCERVCKKEELTFSDEVKDHLCGTANGSARMLLVLMDKIAMLGPDEQKAAIDEQVAASTLGIDLCRALMDEGTKWAKVARILKDLKEEAEAVRRSVLGYARTILLKDGSYRAYLVIDVFSRNLYDSGNAGLAALCYEVINDKGK